MEEPGSIVAEVPIDLSVRFAVTISGRSLTDNGRLPPQHGWPFIVLGSCC
jgi:hypothetical protein